MFQHFESHTHDRPCRQHPGRHAHFARLFGHGGPREHFGRGGFGGIRERMFDTGEFQLVILNLLAEKPSYGYELMKTLETRLAGGYSPSPGVVYPTLTMLEEEGLTSSSHQEGGKKIYTVTEAGTTYLKDNQGRLQEILERLSHTGAGFEQGRSPEFRRAFKNLQRSIFGAAVRARAAHGGLKPEQVSKITAAIETAAKSIDAI